MPAAEESGTGRVVLCTLLSAVASGRGERKLAAALCWVNWPIGCWLEDDFGLDEKGF